MQRVCQQSVSMAARPLCSYCSCGPHPNCGSSASHQDRGTLWKSQWSFKTATGCRRALQGKFRRRTGAGCIGRIERHDAKISAVCVRDFERGRPSCAPPTRVGARRGQAAARHPRDGEGILQCRRPADDHSGARTSSRPKTRCRLRVKDAGCDPRQDQRARARRLAGYGNHGTTTARSIGRAGRLFRQLVGGAGGGAGRCRWVPSALAARPAFFGVYAPQPTFDLVANRGRSAVIAAAAVRPRPNGDQTDGAVQPICALDAIAEPAQRAGKGES